ncbi:integrase, partial [Hellea sp.]|nr:integrase [Hellea sp.]
EPGIFKGLNADATLLVYAMIETGCRPSELSNILPENIKLDAEVPYIQIRSRADRQLKASASSRDIPLVGCALEAFKRAPNGFPRYRDKGNILSKAVMDGLRVRGLQPTPDHRLYSLRHSFEKRMLEAGLDYGLRCLLMGHKDSRPNYGDGGSLAYRRDELLKIAHPIDKHFRNLMPCLINDLKK